MRNRRTAAVITALIVLIGLLFFMSLIEGSVNLSPEEVIQAAFRGKGSLESVRIIRAIRLPRILLSMILGGALALSGYLLQTYFENPIAGPFILGISSGARMTVAAVMVFAFRFSLSFSSFSMILAAFAGSMAVTVLILLLSRRVEGMATLLVAGVMVGYICSALTDFIVAFADDADIVNLHNWTQGSFSGADWTEVVFAVFLVIPLLILSVFLSKPIGAMRLGESYARSVGVPVRMFRILLILMSSLLSACVAAFAGPISFIGVAVPFLMQKLLKSSRPLVLIPSVYLGGTFFALTADLIARRLFSPTELNISTVTAVIGAPVILFMMMTVRRE